MTPINTLIPPVLTVLSVEGVPACSEALSAVAKAQATVQQTMLSVGAGERLARLAKADLIETLLMRASAVIKEDVAYSKLATIQHRGVFLALHLEMALVSWVGAYAETEAEDRAVQRLAPLILGAKRHG
jgi:hypothetical protein